MARVEDESRNSVPAGSKSAAALLGDLAFDIALLVRKELELARNELLDMLFAKIAGAWAFGVALLLALPGLVFLMIALALILPGPAWLGFTLVGVGMIVICAGGVAFGVSKFKKKNDLKQSLESVKRDGEWAKELLRP